MASESGSRAGRGGRFGFGLPDFERSERFDAACRMRRPVREPGGEGIWKVGLIVMSGDADGLNFACFM